MKIWTGLAIATTLAAFPVPGIAAPMNFAVDDVAITGRVPDGYCVPAGQNGAAAKLLASSDPENATPVTLMRCDRQDKPNGMQYDYYLIKAPRKPTAPMKRAEFIGLLAKELALPEYRDGTAGDRSLNQAAGGLTDTMGTRVDLSGEIKPRGTDDVCVYMGGEVTVSSAFASYPIAVGGCGTTVGGKLLFVYSYDDPAKPDGVATQLRRARAIVDSLKAVDGRAN